jgi:hypothetical protein
MKSYSLLFVVAFVHLVVGLFSVDVLLTTWGERIDLFLQNQKALTYVGGNIAANAVLFALALWCAMKKGGQVNLLLIAEITNFLVASLFLKIDYVVISGIALLLTVCVRWSQRNHTN